MLRNQMTLLIQKLPLHYVTPVTQLRKTERIALAMDRAGQSPGFTISWVFIHRENRPLFCFTQNLFCKSPAHLHHMEKNHLCSPLRLQTVPQPASQGAANLHWKKQHIANGEKATRKQTTRRLCLKMWLLTHHAMEGDRYKHTQACDYKLRVTGWMFLKIMICACRVQRSLKCLTRIRLFTHHMPWQSKPLWSHLT